MMRTALTTAELLEPVPRSILLGTLTNNLPPGTSLTKLNMLQKDMGGSSASSPVSNYQAAKGSQAETKEIGLSPEKRLETFIEIEGMAPTDLQVASYIERLGNCSLLGNVTLVESKEREIEDGVYRQFQLKAQLCKNVHLTKTDIEGIRVQANQSIFNF
jgi:Tfp pilus assembly protein PilN